MPKSLVLAREQSLSSRVFAVRVSCGRTVLRISGVLWPFVFSWRQCRVSAVKDHIRGTHEKELIHMPIRLKILDEKF